MLFDSSLGALQLRVIEGMDDKDLQERINNYEVICRTFKPGEGIAGRVLETGKSIVSSRVSGDEDFLDASGSFVDSIACVPMRVYGDIIGVINVTNSIDGTEFSPEEVALIEAIGDQAAVAINKAQLWEMAVTDSLTGLFIRRFMLSKLNEELTRARRYKHNICVAMIDIDHFKRVNDTYGHETGDAVLQHVASLLKKDVRNVDYVGRHGGDEFLLILTETSKEGSLSAVERMRHDMEVNPHESGPAVTISIGLATFPDDGRTVEELIRAADCALYRAKETGRNRVVPYAPDMTMAGDRTEDPSAPEA